MRKSKRKFKNTLRQMTMKIQPYNIYSKSSLKEGIQSNSEKYRPSSKSKKISKKPNLPPKRIRKRTIKISNQLLLLLSPSVMSDSLRPTGLQPTRLTLSMGFSRQEYWSGLPCLPPECQVGRIGKRSPKWRWLKDKEGQRKVRGPE